MEGLYFSMIFSAASLVSSSFILILYLLYEKIRNFDAAKYAFVLQIIDFFLSLISLIPFPEFNDNIYCKTQGFLEFFLGEVLFLWTATISTALYYEIYLEKGRNNFPFTRSLVLILILCMILPIFALFFSLYEVEGSWCFIKPTLELGFAVMFGSFYIPFWILNIWNIYAYIKITQKLKIEIGTTHDGLALIRTLKFCPWVLIIAFAPLFAIRLYESINGSLSSNNVLLIVASCITRTHGLLNSVIYGVNPELKKIIFRKKTSESLFLNNISTRR
ncbi:hypothetical protein SteCoe_3704 [Stentor coeruleus]|uniref:G-protein coupled receptors family 2 profile 2 domain-containing protein n=1 Tax=Stentor coeruleus TaxID=5963 RepID=A0A1R2CWF7_9CILI|nr:hypothetical protein SteCoe_3704 [Stentor coeruleus]